jgi:virulence factor Mce-like protein
MSSRTGNPAGGGATPFTNPVLVGTTIVVALLVGVFLSYNANKGLPFVTTFPLNAKVPDAQQLVEGSEVRIGGFRVGQVNEIVAVPAQGETPAYARLEMKLDGSIKGIPEDTLVRVRPRSVLGSKFVELEPGDSDRDVKPDATLPLRNARESNELDEIFNTFDQPTREGLQGTIRGFGDSVAARGPDINRSLAAIAELMPSAQRVLETLADPETDLDGFFEAAAQFSQALTPVADDLVDLFDKGATTLAAIDAAGDSLGEGIAELPPTEIVGLKTLTDISPVLRDLADITAGLRAGTRELPRTTEALADALHAGTHVLRRTRVLTDPLDDVLRTLGTVARDPAAAGSVKKLTKALYHLRPSLRDLLAAQEGCNLLAVNLRNQGDAVSRGDQQGTWLSFLPFVDFTQGVRADGPTPGLHYNPYPHMNRQECEAGNQPFIQGTQIGNPAGLQPDSTEDTAPPQQATARAAAAGLLDRIPGARR